MHIISLEDRFGHPQQMAQLPVLFYIDCGYTINNGQWIQGHLCEDRDKTDCV
jgi:hypothetical protein